MTDLRRFLIIASSVALGGSLAGAQASEDFSRAMGERAFSFPADHGNHGGYRTEWWYFTGVLRTEEGERVGYQATWFRTGLAREVAPRRSRLAARDLFFFHGAISDAGRDRFLYEHRACRGAPAWAGAASRDLNVWFLDRSVRRETDGGWRLRFRVDGCDVKLRLSPTREPLLHGRVAGLSQKGTAAGQASYYYSHTRLRTEGTMGRPGGGTVAVRGSSWFDHEFGSSQLDRGDVGWDWFSVALDDGTDLMLYVIRSEGGTPAATSAGTVRHANGQRLHLDRSAFSVEVLDHWRSPRSRARYPARWRVVVPASDIDLEVTPVRADQELVTKGTTDVTYWEGLCRFTGRVGGRAVEAWGYVELVGYAKAFRSRL